MKDTHGSGTRDRCHHWLEPPLTFIKPICVRLRAITSQDENKIKNNAGAIDMTGHLNKLVKFVLLLSLLFTRLLIGFSISNAQSDREEAPNDQAAETITTHQYLPISIYGRQHLKKPDSIFGVQMYNVRGRQIGTPTAWSESDTYYIAGSYLVGVCGAEDNLSG
ncbi:MAG: hypothetical protein R3C44_02840 [Chloroflexota bacterium]